LGGSGSTHHPMFQRLITSDVAMAGRCANVGIDTDLPTPPPMMTTFARSAVKSRASTVEPMLSSSSSTSHSRSFNKGQVLSATARVIQLPTSPADSDDIYRAQYRDLACAVARAERGDEEQGRLPSMSTSVRRMPEPPAAPRSSRSGRDEEKLEHLALGMLPASPSDAVHLVRPTGQRSGRSRIRLPPLPIIATLQQPYDTAWPGSSSDQPRSPFASPLLSRGPNCMRRQSSAPCVETTPPAPSLPRPLVPPPPLNLERTHSGDAHRSRVSSWRGPLASLRENDGCHGLGGEGRGEEA